MLLFLLGECEAAALAAGAEGRAEPDAAALAAGAEGRAEADAAALAAAGASSAPPTRAFGVRPWRLTTPMMDVFILAGILTPPLRIDSASEQGHLYLCQKRGQEHCTREDEARFVSRSVSWLKT